MAVEADCIRKPDIIIWHEFKAGPELRDLGCLGGSRYDIVSCGLLGHEVEGQQGKETIGGSDSKLNSLVDRSVVANDPAVHVYRTWCLSY